jgi:monothiol bacilliredoxin
MELKELTSPDQLEEVFERSRQRPQLIFKHSLTCPISSRAHSAVSGYLGGNPQSDADYWLIAVQRSRPTSMAFAEKAGIRHESPQAIIVQAEKAVWNASHFGITEEALGKALQKG